MTVDLLLRSVGVVLAPLVTLLIFTLQDGRRRARLAKQAKTAAELLSLAPPDSRTYLDLVKHYERAVDMYLVAHRPWRWEWGTLTGALFLGVFGVWMASSAWMTILAPKDRPTWVWWALKDDQVYPAWQGWLFMIFAVPFLVGGIRGVLRFLRGGRRSSRSSPSSLGK